MRKIVMFNRVSADGYFADAKGGLDWVVPDPEVENDGAKGIPGTDTVLFGRKTYEMLASFWPHVTKDSPGPHGGTTSKAMLAMADFLNSATKIVFSRSLKDASWKNSRIVREFKPAEIEEMKKQRGKDIIVLGSGSIVSKLTEHGLIDEYQFVVGPIIIGSGKQLISGIANSLKLDLVESKKYKSGNLLLRYARSS